MELRRILALCSFSGFLLLLTGVGTSEGLKCYQCGTFLATTSVSPCLNFTGGLLKECPYNSCSKYVGIVMVYGCENNCQEKQHGSFYSYCCKEDACNHSTVNPSPSSFLILMSSLLCSFLATVTVPWASVASIFVF